MFHPVKGKSGKICGQKALVFFCFTTTVFAQVPVINQSTIHADNVGHASLHITYQLASGSSIPTQGRIRWIASPGTCTGGTGGNLFLNIDDPPLPEDSWWRPAAGSIGVYSMPLHGLSPNTTYQVCPEVTANRVNWSSGVGITVTTDSLPSVHPALPVPPVRFNTDYPNTNGYLAVNLPNNDDCSGLENAYNWAISDPNLNLSGDTAACHDQKCRGVVINLAAGSACVGQVYAHTIPPDTVILAANASTFNTSTSIITTTVPVSEGQALTFAATNSGITYLGGYAPGLLPGAKLNGDTGTIDTDGNGFPTQQLPFSTGSVVYAHITCSGCDSKHFQVYANAPYSAGLCPTGQTSPYSDRGNMYSTGSACPILWQFDTVGAGAILYAPWPRPLNWIVIRTATPDSQFVPEHVRLQGPIDSNANNPTPPSQWLPKMASLQSPWKYLGSIAANAMLFTIGCTKDNEKSNLFFGANIRFVGLEITYQPYPQAAYEIDMPPGQQLINIGMDSSNIIFDRCWIHGYAPPFRSYHPITWNGSNLAFIDSYISDFDFPRQFNFGLGVHQ